MTRVAVLLLLLGSATNAAGQVSPPNTPSPTQASTSNDPSRPATTTFLGDTGLWFVPTADVLAHGSWSASGYRRGTNYVQGFSNVGDFAGTVAFGVADRMELFGSLLFDTRVDRDLRPIFTGDQTVGGIIDRYPRITSGWSGNHLGDLYIGAKVSLMPNPSLHRVALAARGVMKAPTGDDEAGVSTGKPDFLVDVVVSTELKAVAQVSGYAGYEWRGTPADFAIPNGAARWGVGAGVPARSSIRGQFELTGVVPNSDVATITRGPLIGSDLTVAPAISATENTTRATVGATWQSPRGFFVGAGLSWNVPRKDRDRYRTDADTFGDFVDWQVRIGFHPGTRDSGDRLNYRATANDGGGATPPASQPVQPAPSTSAAAPVAETPAPSVPAATQNNPAGTRASSGTTTTARSYTFEDVHFDFDRYSLRPEAMRVLDSAIQAMRDNTTLRLEIEGHTCNIGTSEYNLALGDRRASGVRDYLVGRGVTADRLRTVSYGEERPKYDNAREETRRLNRRAALVVNLR